MNDPVGLLVLTRLLPTGEKGETRAKIGKDLSPLVAHRWEGAAWADRLEAALRDLELSGALSLFRKGKAERYAPTSEGRRLALEALGLDDLPPKTTWAKLKSPYLLALALGRPGADASRLAGAPGLKAELLRAHYELTLDDRPTIKQATDAAAGKLMGLEPGQSFTADHILMSLLRGAGIEIPPGQKPSPSNIQAALFRRDLGEPGAKNPLDLIVARSVGARQSKPAELGEAAIRSWIGRSEAKTSRAQEAHTAPTDLGDFARRVVEAARKSPSGWFGDGKVFIGHVWRAVRFDPASRGLDFDAFKARLVEAHRARLLELGRGDLIEAMDPADVRESATPYLNAVYHFVRTEEDGR